MSRKLLGAVTTGAPLYPAFVNATANDDGSVMLLVRGDPIVRETGTFVCGYTKDRGSPGRCTPGDDRCNNYCNMAPQKGPMADRPKACFNLARCGETVSVTLSAAEWQDLAGQLKE